MSKNNDLFLVIDAQIDFMDFPDSALPVTGANASMKSTCTAIRKVNPKTLLATQDSHYSLCIHSTPKFSDPKDKIGWWTNADGSRVNPFTFITSNDVKSGKFVARYDPIGSLAYVEALEVQGEFTHFLWPTHCEMGKKGHNFHPDFSEVLEEWSYKNMAWPILQMKGKDPRTESFGVFRANIPNSNPSTQVNQGLIADIASHDEVLLMGQAETHCDLKSLEQLIEIEPSLATKVTLVTDCMSPVLGLPDDFYQMVEDRYKKLFAQGVKTVKSTDL